MKIAMKNLRFSESQGPRYNPVRGSQLYCIERLCFDEDSGFSFIIVWLKSD